MIDKKRHIKEMYDLSHFHDENKNSGFDYETNLYNKTMSPVMFKNTTLRKFLDKLKQLNIVMIDSVLIVRNFYDFNVDKYYDKHNN